MRLALEKAHPRCLGPGRPISVSAVPFGPGIDIWRSCRLNWYLDEVSVHSAWRSWEMCPLCYWC